LLRREGVGDQRGGLAEDGAVVFLH
jgi:hypothetical protein